MSDWTEVLDPEALDKALALAKGSYQRDLLRGRESLSGSTLVGRARLYGGRYKDSQTALLRRMSRAGIPWRVETREHGKKILVIGEEKE